MGDIKFGPPTAVVFGPARPWNIGDRITVWRRTGWVQGRITATLPVLGQADVMDSRGRKHRVPMAEMRRDESRS
jgi:hypothetical protein